MNKVGLAAFGKSEGDGNEVYDYTPGGQNIVPVSLSTLFAFLV